jgi:hypothetical protein
VGRRNGFPARSERTTVKEQLAACTRARSQGLRKFVTATWSFPNLGTPNIVINGGFVPQTSFSLVNFVGIFDSETPDRVGIRAGVIRLATADATSGISEKALFFFSVNDHGILFSPDGVRARAVGGIFDGSISPGDSVRVDLSIQPSTKGTIAGCDFYNMTQGIRMPVQSPIAAGNLQGGSAVWGVSTAGPGWNPFARFSRLLFDEACFGTSRNQGTASSPGVLSPSGFVPSQTGAVSTVTHHGRSDGSRVATTLPCTAVKDPKNNKLSQIAPSDYPPFVIQFSYSGPQKIPTPPLTVLEPLGAGLGL